MKSAPRIQVSDRDFEKLSVLLERLPCGHPAHRNGLKNELDRAEVLPEGNLPKDVVTMYSNVVYENVDTRRAMTIQITLPEDADVEQGRVSILAPVGAALLGLEVGQTIEWSLPDGRTCRLLIRQLVHEAPCSKLA